MTTVMPLNAVTYNNLDSTLESCFSVRVPVKHQKLVSRFIISLSQLLQKLELAAPVNTAGADKYRF